MRTQATQTCLGFSVYYGWKGAAKSGFDIGGLKRLNKWVNKNRAVISILRFVNGTSLWSRWQRWLCWDTTHALIYICTMLAYKVSSEQLRHPAQVQAEWQDLQSRCDCSYFQSWGWISCWLKVIALEQQVTLVRVYQGDALVGLGLFVSAEFVDRKSVV